MRKAALFASGRVVVADNHILAMQQLETCELDDMVSGVFDPETKEFEADLPGEHFYDKEIILIRHGTADGSDSLDPNLSDTGVQQAKHLAAELVKFDLKDFAGFTSPMLRCLETCEIVSQVTGVEFQIEPDLIETPAFLGEDEEFLLRNRWEKFPQFTWPCSSSWTFGLESHEHFLYRSRKVLQSLPHKSIVITHCGFICNIARLALCDERAKAISNGVPPASLTYINQQNIRCLGRTPDEKDSQDRPETVHPKLGKAE